MLSTKYSITATSLTALLAVVVPNASRADQTVREQIDAAEHAVGKAIATRDFAAIDKLWSPDMLVNSPGNNILTPEQVVAAIRANKLNYSGYTNEIEAFHVYGEIAVVIARQATYTDDAKLHYDK